MGIVTIFPLLDGTIDLSAIRQARADKVAEMAGVLLANDCYAIKVDARRLLRTLGYDAFEIEALIDDARQVAMQHVVAREMAL